MTEPDAFDAAEDHAPRAGGEGHPKNWMGVAALATGAVGLSAVAIALGHFALRAVKQGTANNRAFALAGTIVGYIALAVTIGLVALYFTVGSGSATVDAHAQADTTAVGAEVARYWGSTLAPPELTVNDGTYQVGPESVTALLTADRSVTLSGNSALDWCLLLTYEGGTHESYSYTATQGLQEGDVCEAAASPSPPASPTASEPGAASPSPTATP